MEIIHETPNGKNWLTRFVQEILDVKSKVDEELLEENLQGENEIEVGIEHVLNVPKTITISTYCRPLFDICLEMPVRSC